uniref:NCK-interacting protein with SH3 domain-like n=1 Tax=Phallusia mammillata TaxID=59560 RepID=A0A6F9DM13_9ASCI|nr:NCK-interacting protein with SH3 domain-like [Phallusia mammillata]
MYKALHTYESSGGNTHTLSFRQGDILFVLEETNSSWWLASSEEGKVGYIPNTYVTRHIKKNSEHAVLLSVERAITAVKATSKGGQLTAEEKSLLGKLIKHKENVIASAHGDKKDYSKRKAPPPPSATSHSKAEAPPPPVRSSVRRNSTMESAGESPIEDVSLQRFNIIEDKPGTHNLNAVEDVPLSIGSDLMELTQIHTNLSLTKSREFLESCMSSIGNSIPSLSKAMSRIIQTFPKQEQSNDPDMESLGLAFANLAEIKDDAQQRNWAINDDELKISNILNDILQFLTECSKEVCMKVVSSNQYAAIMTLATYYQMETRPSIRITLLQIIGVLCAISPKFVSMFLSTVLPVELVCELNNYLHDIERSCYTALVLSMLFSTGEPIPVSYYDTIGVTFLNSILKSVEEGTEGDTDDRLSDILVRLLLSINLHFPIPLENLIMQSIKNTTCTTLSEKIMFLCNRGEDPVKVNEEEDWINTSAPPHSVLKFLQDIFSLKETASSFLYTNDLLVLIDIITRNIADISAGSKLRTEHLDLLLSIVKNSSYSETKHRCAEIMSILNRIKDEDINETAFRTVAEFDKKIVHNILHELSLITM